MNNDKDEVLLRNMEGRAIAIDLEWYPEQYDDLQPEDEEPETLPREVLGCQEAACACMNEIENMDEEAEYEKMSWEQEMVDELFMLVPIEIHMIQGPTGTYPRFWGYICKYYPEPDCWGVKKATISLPSGLSKRIAAFSEGMLDMRANPLEDKRVLMILTTYQGLTEFEANGEMRTAHKFWETQIIQGHRSPE